MCGESIKVNGSECINITVNPTNESEPTVTIETDEFLNQFSDEPLTEDPEKAKNKLSKLISYLKSSRFSKKVNSEAYKTGIPPRQVAKGAIMKAFGILGDILGIAVHTVSHTLNGLVDLLSDVLHMGINLITKAVDGLCRILTFNQTACAS
jgi:hypothetical protein